MTPRLGTIISGSGRGFVGGEWLEIEERGGPGGVAPRLARGPPKAGVAASTFLNSNTII